MKNPTANTLWKFCLGTSLILFALMVFNLYKSSSYDIFGYLMFLCIILPFMFGLSSFADKNKITQVFYVLFFMGFYAYVISVDIFSGETCGMEGLIIVLPLMLVTFPSFFISFALSFFVPDLFNGNIHYESVTFLAVFFILGYLQWFVLMPMLVERIRKKQAEFAEISESVKRQEDSDANTN